MKLGILSLGSIAVGLSWMLSACASGDTETGRPMPMNPNGFGNAQPKAGAGAGAGGTSNFGNPNAQGGSGGSRPPVTQPKAGSGGVCGADVYSGERQRLDIYMMVDDSGSMVPWWPATLEAINMFYRDPGSVGIGVGAAVLRQHLRDEPLLDAGRADPGAAGSPHRARAGVSVAADRGHRHVPRDAGRDRRMRAAGPRRIPTRRPSCCS